MMTFIVAIMARMSGSTRRRATPSRSNAKRAPASVIAASAIVGAALAVAYSVAALARHRAMLTGGYDLGIFTQYAQSFARLSWPVSPIRAPGVADYPLFADHFSPVIALLGPVYALVPRAETLLVVQGLLVAASVPVVLATAWRVWGRLWLAIGISVTYGLSFGLINLILYDFHEIAFAVPLIALALADVVRGRFGRALLWALPLVLVKEDLGLITAGIAALVALRCRRLRVQATLVAVAGGAATITAMLVIIPAFNVAGVNTFAATVRLAAAPAGFGTKLITLVILVAPVLGLCLRSPMILLAVPTLAWRFLAEVPTYWTTGYQYDAVLMPIVFFAFLDRAGAITGNRVRRWIVVGMALASILILVLTPANRVFVSQSWRPSPDGALAKPLIECIPPGVTVATMNGYASQLVDSNETRLIGYLREATPAVVLITTGTPVFPYTAAEIDQLRDVAVRRGMRSVAAVARAGGTGSIELLTLPGVRLRCSAGT